MKDIMISSRELIEQNPVVPPSKAKDFASADFWYYTRLSTLDKILDGKCVYVSNLEGMNDKDEELLHNSEKEFIHCFCLCNSGSEKIPMWYLYSGISGQGAALGFTPSIILRLISSIETVSTPDNKTVLYKDKDFDLSYGWVFYRKPEQRNKIYYK